MKNRFLNSQTLAENENSQMQLMNGLYISLQKKS